MTGGRLTILPEQLRFLADVARSTNKAMALRQDGSTIYVKTGVDEFALNADGHKLDRSYEPKD